MTNLEAQWWTMFDCGDIVDGGIAERHELVTKSIQPAKGGDLKVRFGWHPPLVVIDTAAYFKHEQDGLRSVSGSG